MPTVTCEEGSDVFTSMSSCEKVPFNFCWGIAGTNYSKNVEYINCALSRYDAHCGVLNGKVVGTTINFFALVGKGDFLIEDVTWISAAAEGNDHTNNSLIYLRNDYGSPWNGTITIKDTVAHGYDGGGKTWLIFHAYRNWYYGYTCHFPNIVVDNVNFTNTDTIEYLYASPAWMRDEITIHKDTVVKNYTSSSEAPNYDLTNKNIVDPPEFLKVINNKSGEKYNIAEYAKLDFFYNTKIEIDKNGDDKPEDVYYQNKLNGSKLK